MKLSQTIKLYQLNNKTEGKRPVTIRWHNEVLGDFLKFVGDVDVKELTKETIKLYQAHLPERNLKSVSINTYLRSIKALLRWAYEEEYIDRVPKIKPMLVDPPDPKRVFSPAEFEKLLAAAEEEATPLLRLRAKAVLMVLYSTGMRASELCSARWPDIRPVEVDGVTSFVLEIAGAKRGGKRQVVLVDQVWQAVKQYRLELAKPHGRGQKQKGITPVHLFTSGRDLDEPLTVNALQTFCQRIEKRSGIKCNPHLFRHTSATFYINQGGDKAILQKLAGWKSPEMVLHYGQLQPETLVRAARNYSPLAKSVLQ